MGISASKQWNEMNEINQALEEATQAEKQRKPSGSGSEEKKSFKNRFKTKILKTDPRSASDDVTRTPIAAADNSCETPVKTMALIDPRSPGCVLGGEVVVERTPILVMQKKEDTAAVDTPIRGSTIPPFNLQDTPDTEDSETPAPTSDSPLIMKTQTNKTSTPSTIPLTNSKAGQPSNLLQERMKEAAKTALKDQEGSITSAPAAADSDFLDESDLKVENSVNNDSSLII